MSFNIYFNCCWSQQWKNKLFNKSSIYQRCDFRLWTHNNKTLAHANISFHRTIFWALKIFALFTKFKSRRSLKRIWFTLRLWFVKWKKKITFLGTFYFDFTLVKFNNLKCFKNSLLYSVKTVLSVPNRIWSRSFWLYETSKYL